MKTIIRFFLSIVAVTTALVTGCTPEEEHIPARGGDSFTLSSSEEQAITRAGDVSVNHFTAGTKYRLYGLIGSSWSGRLSTLDGGEGTEVVGTGGTHQIEYLAGTDEDRFEGRTLDFYALTYGNTTLPVCGSEVGGVPVCGITSSAGGVLPDLRRAVLTGQSGINSGVITLAFKHTLSKLKFEVVKQKTEGGSTGVDVLQDIRLKGISVSDYSEGALLLSTGEYSHTGGKSNRAVLGSGFSQTVTESVQSVTMDGQSGSAAAECLIFPTLTTATEGLKIKVATMGTNSGERTDTYEIRVPVMGDDGTAQKDENGKTKTEPFRFLPNYEYTLTITIIDDKVQIITIIPRRYDWINNNDNSQYLGQPQMFNGVMWMDRNLGATSADVSTAQGWEDARGYYYMYGRNIPYYLKREVTGTDGVKRPKNYEYTPSRCATPYPFIPGKEDLAYVYSGNSSSYAMNPDETDKPFNYIASPNDWTSNAQYNWAKTPVNSPCPTGWRLPNKEDVYQIWPLRSDNEGDITFRRHSDTWYTETNTGGDPESGASTSYYCRKENGKAYGTLYAIKYWGKSNAYRLKWTIEEIGTENINDNTGGLVSRRANIAISRYPAASTDPKLTNDNIDSFDWSHPSETIKFPITGYICNDGWGVRNVTSLVYPGIELIMLMNNTGVNNGIYGLKYAGSTAGRSMYITASTALMKSGYPIRCVRDTSN